MYCGGPDQGHTHKGRLFAVRGGLVRATYRDERRAVREVRQAEKVQSSGASNASKEKALTIAQHSAGLAWRRCPPRLTRHYFTTPSVERIRYAVERGHILRDVWEG